VVLVPRLSIFGGDASYGSHRVVAPMVVSPQFGEEMIAGVEDESPE